MKKYLLPFFFIGTVIMIAVMAQTGSGLKTDATPLGIIDLEFAYNSTKAKAVIDAWSPTLYEPTGKIATAKINTWLDFIFLVFYSFFLFFACTDIALIIKGPVAKAGNILAKAALLSGFFDVLENAGMLLTLNGHISANISFFTTFFSVIKWILVLLAILYVLTGSLYLVYRKIKK